MRGPSAARQSAGSGSVSAFWTGLA
jgi:hypothetical protein